MEIDIQRYSSKDINKLKRIKPYWAIKDNINQLLESELNPSYGIFEIFFVNTKDLINNCEFLEVDISKLFTNERLNDTRISRILYFWENGKAIDPPTIAYSMENGRFLFSDGRHRTKLSFFLDIKEIPVAIRKEDVQMLKHKLKWNPCNTD